MNAPMMEHTKAQIDSVFKAVYDQSSHLGGILSLTGILLNANRAAYELIGVTSAEILGKPLWDTPWFIHSSAEAEKLRDGVARAAGGELFHMETTHRAVDGTLRVMDFIVKPAFGESGAPFCLMAEARDITDEKHLETARDANASMLRSVFRATPIGVTFNVARTIHTVNDAMCRLTGYGEREMIGRSARLFYDSDQEFEKVGRLLYDPLPKVERTSVETRFRRKDGASISVILSAAMVDMNIIDAGYVVAVQDITERKVAEEALAQSEDRYRAIMEQSPFSIEVLSPRGDLVDINKAFCQLWGIQRESMDGYNILQDAQIERLGFMPTVHEALAGNRVRTPIVDYDVASTLGSGARKVVQGVFYPIRDAGGNLRSVVLVHIDLT